MRRTMADAGKPDVPGLYISRDCTYFWDTLPYIARDQKRVEDLDSTCKKKAPGSYAKCLIYMVERRRIELPTSALRTRRSPS